MSSWTCDCGLAFGGPCELLHHVLTEDDPDEHGVSTDGA